MKKLITIIVAVVVIVGLFLLLYPHIEVHTKDTLYVCQYNDSFGEFEENASYNERYFYNEKRDISIEKMDVKSFLFFHVLELKYEEGDKRETQFVLEEEYINHFIENAEIYDNEKNIDLAKLIEGKTAIVSNTRYLGNEYDTGIYYTLDGKEDEMYIFYIDDMIVIQVGSTDENPRFIAYK